MTKACRVARRSFFLVVVGSLFLTTLGGPVRAAQAPISGRIVDATTSEPIDGVCVLFYDRGSVPPSVAGASQSGVDGTFSFDAAPGHAYDVAIFEPTTPGDCSSPPLASSLAPEWYAGVAISGPLVPPPAATTVAAGSQNIDICLSPHGPQPGCESAQADGTLTGTVLTTGGIPEPTACIVVFTASDPTHPFGGAITDAQGNYTITGLPDATDLTVGFVPPFTGPSGPCDLSKAPPAPPPGALQPVWSGNVFFNLNDPALDPNPYAASLAQGAQIVLAGDTVDACLTTAPAAQIPRPPCVPAPTAIAAAPQFTG